MRGLFVTATDTGVGKTVLSAALLAAMAAAGEPVRAYKPVVTGLEDEHEITARGVWPPDHELLAAVAGMAQRSPPTWPHSWPVSGSTRRSCSRRPARTRQQARMTRPAR
jgi:dethiobiotin synthetase